MVEDEADAPKAAGPRADVLLTIAVGGALGTAARYGVSQLMAVPAGSFPWDIFLVNLTGSVVLGVVMVLLVERFPPTRYLRPFVAIGFLGAYTTYSTYMVGTAVLLKDGHVATGLTYLFGSAVAGFAAAWLGILCGRAVPRSPRRPRASAP
jgi:CrcB protein